MSIVIIAPWTLDPAQHLHWRKLGGSQVENGKRMAVGPFTLHCTHTHAVPEAQWEINEANGNWLARGGEAYIKHIFDKIEMLYVEQLMLKNDGMWVCPKCGKDGLLTGTLSGWCGTCGQTSL